MADTEREQCGAEKPVRWLQCQLEAGHDGDHQWPDWKTDFPECSVSQGTMPDAPCNCSCLEFWKSHHPECPCKHIERVEGAGQGAGRVPGHDISCMEMARKIVNVLRKGRRRYFDQQDESNIAALLTSRRAPGVPSELDAIAEKAARDLCRELYDRFVMGGWDPQDAHAQAEAIIRKAIEEAYGKR